MRRLALGLVIVAVLAACNDSTPTGTRSIPVKRLRTVVTATGTLDDNIQSLIALWPKLEANALLKQWTTIKRHYEAGKLTEAQQKLVDLTALVLKKTDIMNEPPGDETKSSAATRLVLYMALYIYGSPGTTPPDFVPGGNTTAGVLTPGAPLTLVTPDEDVGVHFEQGSVNGNRIIVVTQNPTQYGPCEGPLTTELCQYPLYVNIESFPDGPLLIAAQAEVCHPEEDAYGGPVDAATHARLRLAHTKPDNSANYIPGGIIRDTPSSEENIEILPLISQDFLPSCEDIVWEDPGPPPIGSNFLERGIHRASRVASRVAHRVGRVLTPRSAYAIDQGAGGSFLDFSPFNNVDPGTSTIDFESPSLGANQNQIVDPYVNSGVTFTAVGASGVVGLVKNSGTSACVPPSTADQKLGTGTTAGGDASVGFAGYDIRATFSTPLAASQSVTVDVQSAAGAAARIRFYDSSDQQVGTETTATIPVVGICPGYPGADRGVVTLTGVATGTAAYAVIDVGAAGGLVFVLDNFQVQ